MPQPTQVHPVRLAHAQDEPLVFYGPPTALHGNIRLHNTSEEKVRLRSLTLETPKLRGTAGLPLQRLELAVRLYPSEQVSAQASICVDPTTPPGTYEATVLLGDRRQPVVIHVTERVDLRVSPQSVSLYTEGERTFRGEFVVQNAGNVPLRLGGKCLVPLTVSLPMGAAIQDGLEKACDAEPNEVLKKLVCAWSEQQVGEALITREDVTLAPGETRKIAGACRLPSNLHSFRRYAARLALYNASIDLEVYTGELPKGREPAKKE